MIFISRRKLSRLNVFQKPKIKEQIQMEKCRYSRSSKTPNTSKHTKHQNDINWLISTQLRKHANMLNMCDPLEEKMSGTSLKTIVKCRNNPSI